LPFRIRDVTLVLSNSFPLRCVERVTTEEINMADLTPGQLLCGCLNQFSDGGEHPLPNIDNLRFFTAAFAWGCVKRSLASELSDDIKGQIRVLTRERIEGMCSGKVGRP